MASESKKFKRGEISRYEPTHMQEINASEFIKISFKQVGCLGLCNKVQGVGYNHDPTTLFSINFKRDHVTIVGVNFIVSIEIVASAIGIPNHGEIWFKGIDLDIENYKVFLKPQYKESPSHIFSSR